MENFLEDHCETGLMALECGTVYHLHILRIVCTCTRSVGLRLRAALLWDAGADPPVAVGSNLEVMTMCRQLNQEKFQTWHGILGCCLKNLHLPHCKEVSKDDT